MNTQIHTDTHPSLSNLWPAVTLQAATVGGAFGLTVAVDVLVASIALAITVGVPLFAVGDIGTVVAGITKRVAVRVLLVLVGDQAAVILSGWTEGAGHDM